MDDDGNQGNEDDQDNDLINMVFNIDAKFIPEEITHIIAKEYHAEDPADTPENVIGEKFPIMHLADAGDHRGKSPDDRHKPGNNDSLATVPLIEFMGRLQMFGIKEKGFGPLEKMWT